MSTDPKPSAVNPPKDLPVEVENPRYEGATIELVGRALLQRPTKDEKALATVAKDEEDQSDG